MVELRKKFIGVLDVAVKFVTKLIYVTSLQHLFLRLLRRTSQYVHLNPFSCFGCTSASLHRTLLLAVLTDHRPEQHAQVCAPVADTNRQMEGPSSEL